MVKPGMVLQGRYVIERRIGGGGMGTVYLADDNRLPGRLCAVKEMSPAQLAPQDRNWSIEAFRQEAQILAHLRHPGLTAVTDFFAEGGNWYLVMDFVEGETLEDRLARATEGRLPPERALEIVDQLCDVLAYLHQQQPPVVFRDLKPGNIMLLPDGAVKLIDFGIARFFKPGQTKDTVNLGTPGYAAPELYGGLGQSDPRADIYSLGAVLYQMVTGYDPTKAVTPFPLPPLPEVASRLPPNVVNAIEGAIRVSPGQRYQTVHAFRQALHAAPAPRQGVQPASPERDEKGAGGWRKFGLFGGGMIVLGLFVWGVLAALNPFDPPDPSATPSLGPEVDTSPTALVITTTTPTHTPTPTRTPTPTSTPTETPLPVPRRLAFDSQRDGDWELFTIREDGSQLTRLTDNTANDGDPAWSRDGAWIAFDSDRTGNWDIFVMRPDGSEVRRLTDHPADDDCPAWSPDGRQVAFKSNRDGNWEIYLVDIDDLSVTNVTQHSGDDRMPAWSPDGRRLAFVSDRGGDWDIWVLDLQSGEVNNLTNHPAQDSFPAWSPDGERITFHSYRTGSAKIFVIQGEGRSATQLTFGDAEDWAASWSPDGNYLAFTSDRDGDNDIYTMDITSGRLFKVTDNTYNDTWPVWAPDG